MKFTRYQKTEKDHKAGNKIYKTISDSRLHTWLRRKLHNTQYSYILRSVENCGKRTNPHTGVHIISDGTTTKILGQQFCENAWICPHCTAKVLAKYEARISIAIQELAKQNIVPFMVTFAVRNLSYIKVDDIFELLYDTYNKFTRSRTKVNKNYKTGKLYHNHGIFKAFCDDAEVLHIIRSSEVTYGINGWHPHLHCLFFIPKENLSKVLKWEQKLQDSWQEYVLRIIPKYINTERYSQEVVDHYLKIVQRPSRKVQGIFISKDNNNPDLPKVFSDGKYLKEIDELTGLMKTANKGHFTPLQLLYEAYEHNDEKAWQKYIELAVHLVSRHRQRVRFSRQLSKMTKQWMANADIVIEYKKKAPREELPKKSFQTVCWFSSEQWKEIFYNDLYQNSELEYLIKVFAKYDDGFNLICQLMECWNLKPPLKKHPGLEFIGFSKYLCSSNYASTA